VSEVSFEYLERLVTVPAAVNGVATLLVLDSASG
jgi:hypothetical protein